MESPKSSRWSFTAYESQWSLFEKMPTDIAEWGWQTEKCPKTEKLHYQGWLRTGRQQRLKAMTKLLPGVHLEIPRNWDALKLYCQKVETAVDGTQRHETNPIKHMSMSEALIRCAGARPTLDYARAESDEDFRKLHIREFEMAVAVLLREDSNLIGLYSQPQYERAYVKWRSVWVEKADELERQTDRQTESESAENQPKLKSPADVEQNGNDS